MRVSIGEEPEKLQGDKTDSTHHTTCLREFYGDSHIHLFQGIMKHRNHGCL